MKRAMGARSIAINKFISIAISCLGLSLCATPAWASQHITDQTGKKCEYCHVGQPDLLTFTAEGEQFVKNYNLLPKKRVLDAVSFRGALLKKIRRVLLAVHAVAATALLGSVIFIGLAAIPRVEEHDVPPATSRFLWLSLTLAGIGGGALLPFTIGQNDGLWTTAMGAYLVIKMVLFASLFALMAFAAATAAKAGQARKQVEGDMCAKDLAGRFTKFSPADLKMFTGRHGWRALIAFKGKVYDVTENERWKYGVHFGKHSAGRDMTDEIKGAPHSESALANVSAVGEYDPHSKQSGAVSLQELKKLTVRYYNIMKLSVGIAIALAAVAATWREF